MSRPRLSVTINDRKAAKLPYRVECESMIALFGLDNNQAALSVRGLNAANMSNWVATLLVRLYEMDPAMLATAVVLIREGKFGKGGAIRDANTGEMHIAVDRDRDELAAEMIHVLETALKMELPK